MKFIRPKRKVDRVFIHCSASDNPKHDNTETIRKWHLERGFSDIGYHYYINKSGQVYVGRPLEKIPAAQTGHNTGTIAICLGGLVKERFTSQQFEALKKLCNEINIAYNRGVTFHGHCEVNRGKTCPVFDYKKVLNLNSTGHMI